MESKATLRYNRQSPFKVRKVLNAVRGANVGTAINYLHFSSEKASLAIEKTIRSAVSWTPLLTFSVTFSVNFSVTVSLTFSEKFSKIFSVTGSLVF